MGEDSFQPEGLSPFEDHTLERRALHADVLGRMFGEQELESVQALGRYEIRRKLGAGGMGEVYLAHDPELDRKVAIKLLHGEAWLPDDAEQRLRHEARAMARVNDAHVVNVHDVGRYQDQLFIAMEYVDGSTLTRWLDDERSIPEILQVFIEAGEGLAAAHDAELVHRDFKPDNVLIGSDGSVKVTDFGIAVVMESWQTLASLNTENDSEERSVAGTLRYMSPEQVRGRPVDAHSDQFSFCVALLEALTGRHPFGRSDRGELIRRLIAGDRRPLPRGHRIPVWVLDAIERGMSHRPGDRWPSMRDLLAVLASDPAARRRRWLMGGALALGVGLVAFLAGQRTAEAEDPCEAGARVIEQVWGDPQRLALVEQFTAQTYGQGSLDAVVPALDDWSGRWRDAYSGLCQSRHERSEGRHEVRIACLTEQRQRVGAQVELLTQADAALVSEAPRLAQTLPMPTDCTVGPLDLAPPSPQMADEVAEIRETLAIAMAELSIDTRVHASMDLAGLRKRLDALHQRAETLGYPPLVVEVAFVQHYEASANRDRPRTRELLGLVYGLGLETRHDRLALRASINMMNADVGLEASPESEHVRELWNETARRLSARLDTPLREELIRRELYVDRLRVHGRRDRVREEVAKTLALLENTVGLDHHLAIDTLSDQAYTHVEDNEWAEALAVLDRIDTVLETWLGTDHPLAAEPLQTRSNVLLTMGRYEEALEAAKRSRRICEVAYGADNTLVRTAISDIATTQDLLGNHAEARDAYQELLGPSPTPDSLEHNDLSAANSLCFVHYKLGEYAEAIEICEAGRAATRRYWPTGSGLEAIFLNNLALVARAQGRLEEGLAIDREALAICENLDPPALRATVYSWIGVGESLLALDRPKEALDPLNRALEARAKGAPDSPEHGEAECLLARARAGAKPEQWPWARRTAREGLARLEAAGRGWERQAQDCRTWLEENGGLEID